MCVCEVLLMFLFHKKSFHMIPSAIIYNKKWNKREKCVFFVNQNFSMPVFTFWSVSRAFCWWVEIQNNKNKNMLKNVERQTIYAYVWAIEWIFMCAILWGKLCWVCVLRIIFLLQFLLSFTQWKLRTFSFGFFCISFPLRIIHPSIFIPFSYIRP